MRVREDGWIQYDIAEHCPDNARVIWGDPHGELTTGIEHDAMRVYFTFACGDGIVGLKMSPEEMAILAGDILRCCALLGVTPAAASGP